MTTVLGIGALGFLYIHNRRGGQWTLESFSQTARDLLGEAKSRAREVEDRASQVVHDVAEKMQQKTRRETEAEIEPPINR
jgi:vacuolar-type H+-ATPase subunit H